MVVLRWLGRGACGVLWSGADLNRRPPLFQSGALPTELPDLCSNARTVARASRWAGATGFEPATSGLTGRRELQTSPRPRCAPRGIRIPVAALKGRSPRPLDDGGGSRHCTEPDWLRTLEYIWEANLRAIGCGFADTRYCCSMTGTPINDLDSQPDDVDLYKTLVRLISGGVGEGVDV